MLIDTIKKAWGWTGIDPEKVVGENDFGNLMVKDKLGRFWRICPEELTCEIVAKDRAGLDLLSKDSDFLSDWQMSNLVNAARTALGDLEQGRKYCLAIPGVLGGKYEVENFKTISLNELIDFSGHVAEQIKDLPDGAKIEFKFVD